MCLKNICDGVGGQDELNGTSLDPPLFWLDNIFKQRFSILVIFICEFSVLTNLFQCKKTQSDVTSGI
jgi:hypothetical protein